MNVFDCHFHIETGLEKYDIETSGKNIIFNSIESYREHHSLASKHDTVSLIFDYKERLDEVKSIVDGGGINALKIHSRIQKLAEADYPALIEKMIAFDPKTPIIVDAFFFGDDLEFQPSLPFIVKLARQFPEIPVIVAHCGGYDVMKFFYHLRKLPNIYFDLSISLAYMRSTSVYADFKNLINFGERGRVMFGTDYPYIVPSVQLGVFNQMADELNMPSEKRNEILYTNARSVFSSSLVS
ncbi:MAG: amidohydrolase family protein [Taibaiella sp.]|nr:amidohydrolase family protein [Taibaiella sp.]